MRAETLHEQVLEWARVFEPALASLYSTSSDTSLRIAITDRILLLRHLFLKQPQAFEQERLKLPARDANDKITFREYRYTAISNYQKWWYGLSFKKGVQTIIRA